MKGNLITSLFLSAPDAVIRSSLFLSWIARARGHEHMTIALQGKGGRPKWDNREEGCVDLVWSMEQSKMGTRGKGGGQKNEKNRVDIF